MFKMIKFERMSYLSSIESLNKSFREKNMIINQRCMCKAAELKIEKVNKMIESNNM